MSAWSVAPVTPRMAASSLLAPCVRRNTSLGHLCHIVPPSRCKYNLYLISILFAPSCSCPTVRDEVQEIHNSFQAMISFSMQSPGFKSLFIALLLVSVVYLSTTVGKVSELSPSWTFKGSLDVSSTSQERRKAIDFRIVGLMFYGRREFVSILHCYLQASQRYEGK